MTEVAKMKAFLHLFSLSKNLSQFEPVFDNRTDCEQTSKERSKI